MSDERLQILKMVQEGKLSAEEATKLLDAVEHGPQKASGLKATHLRVHWTEGKKVSNFSVGVGLVRWLFSLPMIHIDFGHAKLDTDQLLRLIDEGAIGKVMEFTEDNKKLEIWLDP